jgi:hypothetical protein
MLHGLVQSTSDAGRGSYNPLNHRVVPWTKSEIAMRNQQVSCNSCKGVSLTCQFLILNSQL